MATTRTAIAPMKAAQISRAGGDFELVERDIPQPGEGQVRIKVLACGVCHSDVLTKEGVSLGFSILACRAMRSPGWSTRRGRV